MKKIKMASKEEQEKWFESKLFVNTYIKRTRQADC